VEAIPFDETRGYVRQFFGNYWNYLSCTIRNFAGYSPKYSAPIAKALP